MLASAFRLGHWRAASAAVMQPPSLRCWRASAAAVLPPTLPASRCCHRHAAAAVAMLPPLPRLCCHLCRATTAVTATTVTFVFVVVVVSACYDDKRIFAPFRFIDCCLSSCNCCCFHRQWPLLSILSGWLSHCLLSRQRRPSTGAPPPLCCAPLMPLVWLVATLPLASFQANTCPLAPPPSVACDI